MRPHVLLATWFGVGLLPSAPGTFGSLAALPLGLLLHWLGGFPAVILGVAVIAVLGWWATGRYLEEVRRDDPSEVVIDEVAGLLLALAPASWAFWTLDPPRWVMPWPAWIAAFLLFRAFDILKPPPVSWCERPAGATGVMLDDLAAGVLAGICGVALGLFWHLVLM